MRLALAQINPTIGAIHDNERRILEVIGAAREAGADLVVLPELCVSGYPPKDLVLLEGFVESCAAAASRIGERHTSGITVVLGVPLGRQFGSSTHRLTNSLVCFQDNHHIATYDKRLLPTYDVFDEDRYFTPGTETVIIDVKGVKVGLGICEDLWKGEDAGFTSRYLHAADPVEEIVRAGAQILASPSASPFVLGKGRRHRELLASHATRHGIVVASVNQVGGNDELIFDGHSCVYAPDGRVIGASPGFEEDLLVVDVGPGAREHAQPDPRIEAPAEELLFKALRLGLRDYLHKTGFERSVIGLSGGMDSSVTAALAVAALGAENVTGALMPGPYSSEGSKSDAIDLADRLAMRRVTMPIAPAMEAIKSIVDPAFAEIGARSLGETLPDVTEENVQARIRGILLMALSNRTGDILLTTGNKSEIAVGYCTLYGDMNGGLAVISDVLKTQLYDLARWMNANYEACGFSCEPIPQSTIDKPPSAELAPDQRDEDSLPPYPVLDQIIERYVEQRQQPSRIAAEASIDEVMVDRVVRMIDNNEYKRKQMATGLKVTHVAFGFGRRMPIAQGWIA